MPAACGRGRNVKDKGTRMKHKDDSTEENRDSPRIIFGLASIISIIFVSLLFFFLVNEYYFPFVKSIEDGSS
jgi:hypothetical protein